MARYSAIASAFLLVGTSFSFAADDLKDKVAKAVAAGQKYLKAARAAGDDGLFGRDGINVGAGLAVIGGNGSGTPVLTGLALIEGGLDTKDATVAGIASAVRQSFMNTNSTYEISCMIMFLDRVAAKQDEPIIQFLTLRLMSGQTSQGGWFYTCDGLQLDPVQSRQLMAELVRGVKLITPATPPVPKKETRPRDDLDPAKKDPEPKKEAPPAQTDRSGLHPALEKIARGIQPGMGARVPPGAPGGLLGAGESGDHSNTQFATVALWCGRRHGVNVSDALKLIDKHYRDTQGRDGGWGYAMQGTPSSPSMTCAGLMGLAMGIGSKNLEGKGSVKIDPEAIAQDRHVESGLKYVGTFLRAAGEQRDARGGGFQTNDLTSDLYFMWSLERVGMVYGLQTIGNLDWYDWGARVLISTQAADGSWSNRWAHHGSTENATAFALLFLMRSNLAQEVSSSMKGKVKDPGSARLVGGRDLSKIIGESGQGTSNATKPTPVAPRPKGDNPPSDTETDKGGKLASALANASAAERADLLTLYRDSKGGEYTDALARAATKMTGDAQAQVRDALAQRLTRMTISTLNDFMKDGDRELRRSAALAAGSKSKDRIAELATTLIRLIGDDEPIVVQAARASLRTLSGQDYGPEAGSAPSERGKALIAWRGWWEGQKK